MRPTPRRDPRPWPLRAAPAPGLALLALLAQAGCSGGDEAPPASTTTTVEVCVDEGTTDDGPVLVEVRQDGEVVGTVSLGSGGTAGVSVPPGPVEAYVDGELVGSGELGEGASISFTSDAPPPTEGPSAQPEPSPGPGTGPAGAATPTPTSG